MKYPLTVFFDSRCPLCAKEMQHLLSADNEQRLVIADIHEYGFIEKYPHIDPDKANQILHAQSADGLLYLGLDATHAAWSAVGKGWRTGFLRWPLIKIVADVCYYFFAQHRYRISWLLTGQSRCQACENVSNKLPVNKIQKREAK